MKLFLNPDGAGTFDQNGDGDAVAMTGRHVVT